MNEKIIIHSFKHPQGMVRAIDVQVEQFGGDKKKVYFRISWHCPDKRIRGWFRASVPVEQNEFCLVVEEGPITYVTPGLHPATNGQPILIFQTCWAVGAPPPKK